MATCVLCGCEVSFLGQYAAHLCSTEQPLCKQCSKQYDRADKSEKERLRERMLASPHLRKREKVMECLAKEQANMERLKQKRLEEKQKLDTLTARMEPALRCCDTPMTCLGRGRYTQFDDNLLPSMYERPVVVFECPTCGQIKFFNPNFIPSTLREKG